MQIGFGSESLFWEHGDSEWFKKVFLEKHPSNLHVMYKEGIISQMYVIEGAERSVHT